MKVLIHDGSSQLFLGYCGTWTDNPKVAKDLGFTAHAEAVAKGMALTDYKILFYFPGIDFKADASTSANSSHPIG